MPEPTLIDVPRGLKNVAAAETTIGNVRGREGFYHYRHYNAIDLATERKLEEVWYLLYEGPLPSPDELEGFGTEIRSLRTIGDALIDLLPAIAKLGRQPLHDLRAAYATLAVAEGFEPWLDVGREELRRQGLRAGAVFPTLAVALYRLRRGEEPVRPHPDLDHVANYLYMLSGDPPDPERARALEQYLISTIDHGFNASTFTARVIASTGADLGSAVIGALGALSGPLHGGAPARVLDMLDAIGTAERADDWIRNVLERGERLMGFGHPVYKTEDPRSRMLKQVAERLGSDKLELAKHVEERAIALLRELRPGHELYANVEYYASLVLDAVGLPRELFTPTFAVSRVIGWTAHVLEQTADNEIIRPSARYVGPVPA